MQQVISPSSNREPGTLQYGVLQHAPFDFFISAPVAARSDGRVLCATCSAIVAFDATLHEIGRVDLDSGGSGSVADIAVAPDDTVYAVIAGTLIRIDDLTDVSTADASRWRAAVGGGEVLVAGTEGPYVEPGIYFNFGVPPHDLTVRGFDAMTGQPRTVASGQYLLAAARGGGVFTVEQQGNQSVTLRRLDPAGTVVWSRMLTSTNGLGISSGVATADGGVSVLGSSASTVDFGDRTLASGGSFVAGFDASGATQWAFQFQLPYITHMAVTAQGEILLAGNTAPAGPEGTLPTDAFLSVATPTGISRTLHFSGEGDQFIVGLAATPDGFALIDIGNFKHDDAESDPVMQVGDHMFTDSGYYLFKIVP